MIQHEFPLFQYTTMIFYFILQSSNGCGVYGVLGYWEESGGEELMRGLFEDEISGMRDDLKIVGSAVDKVVSAGVLCGDNAGILTNALITFDLRQKGGANWS
ncbi:hypothetical protein Tco_0046689 [Tanacetum coccineum]